MSRLTTIACVAVLLGFSLHLQAASFNCEKAGTKVEHLICDNPDISKLDDELGTSYKAALQAGGQAAGVRRDQENWLADRNKCGDAPCLRAGYVSRLAVLNRDKHNTGSATPAKSALGSDQKLFGEYVLRATSGLRDDVNYRQFCAAYTANLNEFRNLDFDTCSARLSPQYPRFSRPQWEEMPLDMDMVKKIVGSPPGMRWEYWLNATGAARAANQVKLWRIRVDLLNDGNLDTLVRLDHYQDTAKPSCSYVDSRQIIVAMTDSKDFARYSRAHFDNFFRLGSDMIYDAETKRYFLMNYRHIPALGGGISLADIGATASVMVSGANQSGIWPVCWIDWVPPATTAHARQNH